MDDVTTKVLCLFRYWAKDQVFDDSVMIHVVTKDQICDRFEEAIARARRRGWCVGPEPRRWILTGYLTERPLSYLH